MTFTTHFQAALTKGSFIKCTLSKPTDAADSGLTNVYLRPVALKKGPHIAFTYRYRTRDEVKNYAYPEAIRQMEILLRSVFRQAVLMTTEADWTLQVAKDGSFKLSMQQPIQMQAADTRHDRPKQRLLNPAARAAHHQCKRGSIACCTG